MTRVTGTYSNGKVVLHRPVGWPDGMQVNVVSENDVHAAADTSINGSEWEDSPEARRRWAEWFDSLEPVFTGDEVSRFEQALRTAREEQKAVSAKWQEKIDHLLK